MLKGKAPQLGAARSSSHVYGAMKSRGALSPAGSTTATRIESRGKGGLDTVGSPATRTQCGPGADTAVSIEREVVFGHAYAVLTPDVADGGRCGYENPTNLSVDGVCNPQPRAPALLRRGPRPEVFMAQPDDMFGDDDYPAYTMGRAAEITGASPDFLRRIGEAKLITPLRSAGGHRRYSRYQLRLAVRAKEMVEQGTALEAACRIIILEDQLEEALRQNELRERRQKSDSA